MDVSAFLGMTDRDINQGLAVVDKHSWATKVLLQTWEADSKLGKSCTQKYKPEERIQSSQALFYSSLPPVNQKTCSFSARSSQVFLSKAPSSLQKEFFRALSLKGSTKRSGIESPAPTWLWVYSWGRWMFGNAASGDVLQGPFLFMKYIGSNSNTTA